MRVGRAGGVSGRKAIVAETWHDCFVCVIDSASFGRMQKDFMPGKSCMLKIASHTVVIYLEVETHAGIPRDDSHLRSCLSCQASRGVEEI